MLLFVVSSPRAAMTKLTFHIGVVLWMDAHLSSRRGREKHMLVVALEGQPP